MLESGNLQVVDAIRISKWTFFLSFLIKIVNSTELQRNHNSLWMVNWSHLIKQLQLKNI